MRKTNARNIVITIVLLLIVISSILYIYSSNSEEYETLYIDLSLEEAYIISELLNKEGVSWKQDTETGDISISQDDLHKIDKNEINEMLKK